MVDISKEDVNCGFRHPIPSRRSWEALSCAQACSDWVSSSCSNLEHVLELTSPKLSHPKWKLNPSNDACYSIPWSSQASMTCHSWVDEKQIQLIGNGNRSQCSFLIEESFTALGLGWKPFWDDLNECCGILALLPSQEHFKWPTAYEAFANAFTCFIRWQMVKITWFLFLSQQCPFI